MQGSPSSERYAERCALARELAQVLDMVGQLEAHMGGADGEERCRALVSSMRSSVDRSIHIAMSCRVLGGAPESPPSVDHGSPRSGGSDQAADSSRCRGNAAGQCKKRKTLPKRSMQVRVSTVQDFGPLDDGFSWRKYGQKDILGAKYPRAYFRCTHRHTQSCHASKQVQRTDGDPLLFDVMYHGNHTCAQSTRANSQRQRPAASSADDSQPQPGQEQSSIVFVGFKAEVGTQGLEHMLPPFPLPSEPAEGADTGHAASSDFPSCAITAPPFVSTAKSECQVTGSDYAAVGGSMAGVRNVPDAELTSTMGDMDFMLKLDADFFDDSSYF